MLGAGLKDGSTNLLKHRVNPMRHGGGPVGTGDEVGQAHGDVGSQLLHGLGEDTDVATGQDLGTLDAGISTAAGLVDVTIDVRVSHQSENS